jgi:hypothetical protein
MTDAKSSDQLKIELLSAKVDRLTAALRRAATVLKQYEHCRHASRDCFCTAEAREAVRTLELTGALL